ncbi:hypothetical protein [Paraburkholderia sp. BCC1885]|uniref:hypothetical protein n=1 Tax=Paraburkholderia sp. BCC1885 TaxID=2562669 RepID=UPI001181EAFD|nr:hypothetical protein [Paraburkholderia sp. BCC1885]
MHRLTVLATGLLLATSALAGQPGNETPPTAAATVASVPPSPAAADRVYPPLPTLSMLPPATDDDDEPLAKPATARKKKVRGQERKSTLPAARLVVSDASHVYLGNIEKQLDLALAK